MRKRLNLICIFLLALLGVSCELDTMGVASAAGGGMIEAVNGEVDSLVVLSLDGIVFNEIAPTKYLKGMTPDGLLVSKDEGREGVDVTVARTVSEGDSSLSLRVKGVVDFTQGEHVLPLEFKISKQCVVGTNGGAFSEDLTMGLKIVDSSKLEEKLPAEIVMSGKNQATFAEGGKYPTDGGEVTLNLVNMRFSAEGLGKLKRGEDIGDDIIESSKVDWLHVYVSEAPDENADTVTLSFSGAPPKSQNYAIVFSIGEDWLEKKTGNVEDPDPIYLFNYKYACEKIEYVSPEAKITGDTKAEITSADSAVSGSLTITLSNIYFNEQAVADLRKGSDLSSLNAVSGLPSGISLTVAQNVSFGDKTLKLALSGKGNIASVCYYTIIIKKEWISKVRSNVSDIEDISFRNSITNSGYDKEKDPEVVPDTSDDSGSGKQNGPETGAGEPGSNEGGGEQGGGEQGGGEQGGGEQGGGEQGGGEQGGGEQGGGEQGGGENKGATDPVNSMELKVGVNTLNVPSGAKNLYTITIGYPAGQYTGRTTGSYTIKGSGSVRSAGSLVSKNVPSGTADWNDMYSFTFNNMPKTLGKYWFTDEDNKIKYYIDSNIYNGIWGSIGDSYWNSLKNELLNKSLISGSNTLKKERDIFKMEEYDKDQTEYFYVIFCDFGEGTATTSGGTAGVYTSANLRGSNNADIFYVNSRFTEAFYDFHGSGPYKSQYEEYYKEYAVKTACSTLLHEYMHYLMDAYRLRGMEGESRSARSYEEYYTSMLHGSLFWIEGTANHAPYATIGNAGESAVSQWLGIMQKWRPPISGSDSSASAGNGYAVYGAGGLFFSYVAEYYGQETESKFHRWRETFDDVANRDKSLYSVGSEYVGNINNIVKTVLDSDFKDEYVKFLCQCMSAVSDSVALPGCVQSGFKSPVDWGFVTKSPYGGASTFANAVEISNATRGSSMSGLPELSFVINKWNQIPEKIELEGSNIKSYAIWF